MPCTRTAAEPLVTAARNPSDPRDLQLLELKLRIDAAAYVVDPVVVADALLRRGVLPPVSSRGGARSR
jgi:hypothetical protein